MIAVALAVRILMHLGVDKVVLAECPKCQTPMVASAGVPYPLCGYCGEGPWQVKRSGGKVVVTPA